MPTPLSEQEIQHALTELPGWTWSEDRLKKGFVFGSFREAVSFIVRLAFSAEELNTTRNCTTSITTYKSPSPPTTPAT